MYGGPTPKYRHMARDPIDGVPLTWHSHPDGYPVRRGDSPSLIERGRLPYAQTQLFARSKCFKIPEQIEEFEKVMDWIGNTGSHLYSLDKKETPEGWLVWLTWYDIRGFIPNNAQMPAVAGKDQ